jgi:hypothetical protein
LDADAWKKEYRQREKVKRERHSPLNREIESFLSMIGVPRKFTAVDAPYFDETDYEMIWRTLRRTYRPTMRVINHYLKKTLGKK